jgi:uncharacterized membrane protein YbhN (UPF0104 family)
MGEKNLVKAWKSIPEVVRRWLVQSLKVGITIGAFYLLLTHKITASDGSSITVWDAIRTQMGQLEMSQFIPFLLIGTFIKFIGIGCSMYRWHLLLQGQGIRFNFWHIIGSFLIGRFLGTFLPSTVGLDSYKLYDAAKFSGRVVEPAAATAVEKVMGLAGVFMTFLITLPLGYQVLGKNADTVVMLTVPIALSIIIGLFAVLFRPGLVQWGLGLVPSFGRQKLEGFINRVSTAASAYSGKGRLLATVVMLSFLVHFLTAAMYYFTALAVGAASAGFWEVSFASSIQIFATVISPFTIAGEGVREAVQAMLLAKHIGVSESILSAALGFWAAEAMTLAGAFFLWGRKPDYKPTVAEVDGKAVVLAITDEGDSTHAVGKDPEPMLSEASA